MESEISNKVKERGFFISRFPSWAKELFVDRANQEFEGDYGMCLATMMKECIEYNKFKELIFSNQIPISINTGNIRFANGKQLNHNGG